MSLFKRKNKDNSGGSSPNDSKNYSYLKNQKETDSYRYRDVYESQDLKRGEIGKVKSKTSRIVIVVILSILVFLASLLAFSGISFVKNQVTKTTQTMNMEVPGVTDSENEILQELRFNDSDLNRVTTRVGGGYSAKDLDGNPTGEVYENKEDVPLPEWYLQAIDSYNEALKKNGLDEKNTIKSNITLIPILLSLVITGIFASTVYIKLMKNLRAQNIMNETEDINQYEDDQHIALPEEVMANDTYDFFPDAGAHAPINVSTLISHIALSNKGVNKIEVAKKADKDILDKDGDIVYFKGDVLYDDNGEVIRKKMPMFDDKFAHQIFDASKLPNNKQLRKFFDPSKINYNEGNQIRERMEGYDTVADAINATWTFPDYENQRPGGCYIVDTAPVNTMCLAITRGGKGQTIIEPTVDMLLRSSLGNNLVVNDPKGELTKMFFVPATLRGYQVVQFNLMNPLSTDIYNPLAMCIISSREGDFTSNQTYLENLASVFFPLDGGDDPVWPNAANNAFKRACLGLIDYYLEAEANLRNYAQNVGMSEKVLQTKIDKLWGKVTLYNAYQFFVQLTSKKLTSPAVEFAQKEQNGEFDDLDPDTHQALYEEAERSAEIWNGEKEADMLTLFFAATDKLPLNSIRRQVGDTDKALKSMGGAEKMMAS